MQDSVKTPAAAGDASERAARITAHLALLSRAMAADFVGIEVNVPSVLIEKFPHILKRLNLVWPGKEASAYLDGLMVSDRLGREGFSTEALADIFFLRQLHDLLYKPETTPSTQVEDALHAQNQPRNKRELADRFGQDQLVRRQGVGLNESGAPLRPAGWGEIGSLAKLRETFSKAALYAPDRTPIGQILVAHKVITDSQRMAALDTQRRTTGRHTTLGAVLVAAGALTTTDVQKALCLQCGIPLIDLDAIPMSAEAAVIVSADTARETGVIPLTRVSNDLVVAFEDPMSVTAMRVVEMLRASLGLNVRMVWADASAVGRRLRTYAAGHTERGQVATA